MSVRLSLSEMIYPRHCLQEAIKAYSGLCSVQVFEIDPEIFVIEIEPSADNEADKDRVAREFMNYLLDLSLEQHLGVTQNRNT